ncbi:uncharacterized protein [Manis javanica]|uniref:uncharacterized protein isoform X1 n=1 Tax=Manis javanica TaxID=9974 RepID=UPI003C6CF900
MKSGSGRVAENRCQASGGGVLTLAAVAGLRARAEAGAGDSAAEGAGLRAVGRGGAGRRRGGRTVGAAAEGAGPRAGGEEGAGDGDTAGRSVLLLRRRWRWCRWGGRAGRRRGAGRWTLLPRGRGFGPVRRGGRRGAGRWTLLPRGRGFGPVRRGGRRRRGRLAVLPGQRCCRGADGGGADREAGEREGGAAGLLAVLTRCLNPDAVTGAAVH